MTNPKPKTTPAHAAPIDVTNGDDIDRTEWDAYVRAHSDGTFFHLSGWGETIRTAYGYEPQYVTARRDGVIVGILPLTDVRSPLLGRAMISSSFTVGGGPLADDGAALTALLDHATQVATERRVKYIECRSDFEADQNWRVKTGQSADFRIALLEDEDAAFKLIPRRRRADIRKAMAIADSGRMSIRYDNDIDTFYAIYADAMRRLGTPVFPKRFLQTLIKNFAAETEIAVVDCDDEPVTALLSFFHGKATLPYYAGVGQKATAAHAYTYLVWRTMRRAADRGLTEYDFGRSKIGSGPFQYKKLWGIEPEFLTYRVRLIEAGEMPNVSPNNPKFALFSNMWRRLPTPVANIAGPLLAPNFP